MACAQLLFYVRDLAVAAIDSCRCRLRSAIPLAERRPTCFVHGSLAGVLLPAPNDHVGVLRVQFHQPCFSRASFAGNQRRSRAAEEVSYNIAGLAAIEQSPFHQLDGLHRGVQPVRRRLLLLPERALRFVPVPRILLACDMAVEQGLVLEFIPSKSPRERVLGPDDLTAKFEPPRFQRVLKLTLERRRVADIQRGAGL